MEDIIGTDLPQLRELKPVSANDLTVAEFKRVVYQYTLRPGQSLDDLLVADSWSTAAQKLHRRDLIEVEAVDGSLWALLLVTEAGPEYAKLAVLHRVDLPTRPLGVDDLPLGWSAHFLGSRRLWCVMHDGQIIKHSFTDKTAAITWCIESLRS